MFTPVMDSSVNPPQSATRRFHLEPVAVTHQERIASWYRDLDELLLIESNLPMPVNSESLKTLWRRDIEQKAPRIGYLFAPYDDCDKAVGFTEVQDINLTHGTGWYSSSWRRTAAVSVWPCAQPRCCWIWLSSNCSCVAPSGFQRQSIHTENILRILPSPGNGERNASSSDHGPVATRPTL